EGDLHVEAGPGHAGELAKVLYHDGRLLVDDEEGAADHHQQHQDDHGHDDQDGFHGKGPFPEFERNGSAGSGVCPRATYPPAPTVATFFLDSGCPPCGPPYFQPAGRRCSRTSRALMTPTRMPSGSLTNRRWTLRASMSPMTRDA